MQIYIHRNNQQSGPFDSSVVIEQLRSGSLSPNNMGCPVGASAWQRLGDLFPDVENAAASLPQPNAEAAGKKGGCAKSGLIGAGILLLLLGIAIAAGSRFIPSTSCDLAKSDLEQIDKLQRDLDKMRSDGKYDGLSEKTLKLKSLESGYETSRKYCDSDRFRNNLIGGAGAVAAFVGFLTLAVGLFLGRRK